MGQKQAEPAKIGCIYLLASKSCLQEKALIMPPTISANHRLNATPESLVALYGDFGGGAP